MHSYYFIKNALGWKRIQRSFKLVTFFICVLHTQKIIYLDWNATTTKKGTLKLMTSKKKKKKREAHFNFSSLLKWWKVIDCNWMMIILRSLSAHFPAPQSYRITFFITRGVHYIMDFDGQFLKLSFSTLIKKSISIFFYINT